MMNQKQAVIAAIKSVTTITDEAVTLTREQKDTIVSILVEGFNANEIALKSPQKNMRVYCSGLLNNWLRKDPTLNGNQKYTTKNPGSRTKDPVLKNLKALLNQTTDPQTKAMIQLEIDQLSIKPIAKPAIDLSMIPEDIRIKLGL